MIEMSRYGGSAVIRGIYGLFSKLFYQACNQQEIYLIYYGLG